jgi:ATP-dependent DNA helicase Rep
VEATSPSCTAPTTRPSRFEQALRKRADSVQGVGRQSFFDRAEIKDLCAWLRLWINNDDDPAFLRAITTPKRGIGHTTLALWASLPRKHKLSLFEALFSRHAARALPAKARRQPARVRPLRERPGAPRPPHHGAEDARAFADRLAQGHRLRAAPVRRRRQREGGRRALDQRAGVLRLDGPALRRPDRRHGRRQWWPAKPKACWRWRRPSALLSTISEREQDQDMVTLSTLHASQGLEWPHVMLVGVTEGMLPFKLDDDEAASKVTPMSRASCSACRKSAA